MNQEHFDTVIAKISNDPDSFHMKDWARRTDCGTVACLAGHCALAAGWELNFNEWSGVAGEATKNGEISKICDIGQQYLDLTDEQADTIFTATHIQDVESLTTYVKTVLEDTDMGYVTSRSSFTALEVD